MTFISPNNSSFISSNYDSSKVKTIIISKVDNENINVNRNAITINPLCSLNYNGGNIIQANTLIKLIENIDLANEVKKLAEIDGFTIKVIDDKILVSYKENISEEYLKNLIITNLDCFEGINKNNIFKNVTVL